MAEQAQLDPVAMIQAQLALEKPAPEKPEPAKAAETPEQAPAEPEPEGETQPEAEVAPEENTQVEGDDLSIPLDRLEAIELEVTVKGEDGKDVVEKPTVKELRDGYMRQKDYSRKTAELARQREELSEKTRQGIEGERSQYLSSLQTLQQALIETVAPELKGVDWNNLATNDPAEYVRLRNRADQISQVLVAMQSKQKEAQAKITEQQSQAQKKAAQEAVRVLETEIPGWNDALYQTLMKTGEAVGYKMEEVAQWIDPRAMKLLHKAYLYDQLKADKPPTAKKVAVPPKVLKPGTTSDTSRGKAREVEAMKRLQESGKINDAAEVIRSRL